MASPDTSIEDVLRKEVEAIHTRRRVAGVMGNDSQEGEHDTKADSINQTLVGLALSGGGVRSGAFCLGFIQSLYSAGRMRAVDIISSVSGGGYAASLFSAETVDKESVNWDQQRDCPDSMQLVDRLPIEPNPDGSQPDRIKELALYGRMMGDFIKLLSRHLAGFLVTFLFISSGVVAVAALLAILMRLPYGRAALPYLHELKFMTDLTVPFFPAFLALLFWLGCISFGRVMMALGKNVPSIVKYSYVLLMSTLVLGLIAFLAIGDVDLTSWIRRFNWPDQLSDRVTSAIHWLSAIISGVFLTLLLPVFAPKRFLESGAKSASGYRQLIFNATGYALLVGVPLFVYFVLVQEDISNYTLNRPNSDLLTEGHLGESDLVYETLRQEQEHKEDRFRVGQNLLTAFHTKTESADEPSKLENDVQQLLAKLRQKNKNEDEISFFRAWVDLAFCLVTDDYKDRVEVVQEHDKLKKALLKRINKECLSDPWLVLEGKRKTDGKAWLTSLGIEKPEGGVSANSERHQSCLAAIDRLESAQVRAEQLLWRIEIAQASKKAEAKETNKAAQVREEQTPINKAYLSNIDFLKMKLGKPKFNEASNRPFLKNWFNLCEFKDQGSLTSDKSEEKLKVSSVYGDFIAFPINEDDPNTALEAGKIRSTELAALIKQVRLDNWVLLNAMYPRCFRERDTTFAVVVNVHDQWHRFYILIAAMLVFLIIGVVTNLNNTNLHGVYKEQLASTWLPQNELKLSMLQTCKLGAPLHLIHGTLNRMGTRSDPDPEQKSRFTMSHLYCGSKKVGFRPTEHYGEGDMTVADAIAISGAAVSPVTSTEMLGRILLYVTNFRLGQWLINPKELEKDQYWPSPISSILNLLRYPEQRKYLFVTDGGHLDNTGLAALLERRCKLMILADASFDPKYQFLDFTKLIQDARSKYGIRIVQILGEDCHAVDALANGSYFEELRPNENGVSKNHFVVVEIEYPDSHPVKSGPKRGIIVLCKSSLTGDEVPELLELARNTGEFPHDKTSDQFLPPNRFEAYLEMGRHIAESLDASVEKGQFDCFNLPMGWQSDQLTLADACEELELGGSHLFLDSLEDKPFDKVTIEKALGHLKALVEKRAAEPTGQKMDDVTELSIRSFCNWARGSGENTSKVRKKEICNGMGLILKTNFESVLACPVMHLCFWKTMDFLGEGNASTKSALARLENSKV